MHLQKFERHLSPDRKLHQSWYENGWRISTGTSFHSIFLNLFLFCSIIDTKYVCKISRGCARPIRSYIEFGMNWAEEFLQVWVLPRFLKIFFYFALLSLRNASAKVQEASPSWSEVTSKLIWKWLKNFYRYEFSLDSFKSFFILLYYSYEMRLQKFERHLPPDRKLHQSWYEMGWRIATGTSFHSFLLILFLFCSIIATKYVCKISRGCAHPIRSYIKFGMNWAEEFLQVRVLPHFF